MIFKWSATKLYYSKSTNISLIDKITSLEGIENVQSKKSISISFIY